MGWLEVTAVFLVWIWVAVMKQICSQFTLCQSTLCNLISMKSEELCVPSVLCSQCSSWAR
jgi:hypothetical protein